MKTVHSIWALLILIVLTLAFFNAVIGFIQKKEFTHKDFRLGLFTLILTHTQLLIGFAVYFINSWFTVLTSDVAGTMKDSYARLLTVEHPLMMIVAIVLITIGWSKHKKKVKSEAKFKTFAIFYGLALFVILSRVPWSNWLQF